MIRDISTSGVLDLTEAEAINNIADPHRPEGILDLSEAKLDLSHPQPEEE